MPISHYLKKKKAFFTLLLAKNFTVFLNVQEGFPGGSDSKESANNAGDLGLIPGQGNGYPLQHSCLEKSMDRGAWWTVVHGVAESYT